MYLFSSVPKCFLLCVSFCLSVDHLLALCIAAALSVCISSMMYHGSRKQHSFVRCPSSAGLDRHRLKWTIMRF